MAGAAGESEATEIKTLLEANNIKALVTRDTTDLGMPSTVRVARKEMDRALVLINDFATAGSLPGFHRTIGRERRKHVSQLDSSGDA